ncbi:NAD-dependent epimerase/dehydratase family protein [Tessaracoccus caeni]|uniref:NAD-dependent epimerase/dehydratase family protein n=1 Tax=Tessaracoccus caeni TaxID=3031239 RepID=UPI0023DAA04A|nr:NAD(P)-dependent oxidoreductase [Tessaracoccus caeni]MDF1489038.1 NAD(P)-dependent oxidoreductase [Tessaracoccus caeni]
MRIVVIGGSGHIGTFLVPRLVRAGHQVFNITRSGGTGYADAPAWEAVTQVVADRQQQDADGTFGATVLSLEPDVVIDLVCFTLESATALVNALRGNVGHLIHCGSIWRYGPSRKLPIAEDSDSAGPPFDEYGLQKAAIARMLKEETASGGLVTTSIHPGHIVGRGWHPTGPLGNIDPNVWHTLSAGDTIRVPGSGTETLHHVHADDLAQAFELAVEHRDAAAGEDFNIVAPTALTVRGYIEIASGWFGRSAMLEPITWDDYRASTTEEYARESWGHLHRSQVFTIEKAKSLLGYAPRYEPEQAILEAIAWLIAHDQLDVDAPLQAGIEHLTSITPSSGTH